MVTNNHRTSHWKLGISLSLALLLGFNSLVLTLQVSRDNFNNLTLSSIFQEASAATVTITTSASASGGKFFGVNLLQVIIDDENANSNNDVPNTTINPTIEVRDDAGVLLKTTTISVPDTSDGSREFEFFLVKQGSTLLPDDPDNDDSPVIGIGPGGDISTTKELADGFTIRITHGSVSTTVTYDDGISSLSTDRTSYSIGSEITMTITDFDANSDPTKDDIIRIVLEEDDGFFDVRGAESFNDMIIFEETDENTGIFEAEFLIGIENDPDFSGDLNVDPDKDTTIVFVSIRDSSVYMDDSNEDGTINEDDDPLLNLESNVEEVTITIEEGVNLLVNLVDPTFGSELAISINAPDRNSDSGRVNTFSSTVSDEFQNPSTDDFDPEDLGNTGVIVYIDANGGDIEAVPMKETGRSTGLFVPDYSDNKFEVTFLSDGTLPTRNNGKLEFTLETIQDNIKVTYVDDIPNPNDRDISTNTLELKTVSGTIDVPDITGVNSEFTFTISDPDLNNDALTKDVYSILLDGDAADSDYQFAILKRGEPIGDLAGLELLIVSRHLFFETPVMLWLIETGLNTGNFSASIDMNEIIQSADLSVTDGQIMEFVYHDNMEENPADSSDSLKIAKSGASLSVSREILPIPPEEGSARERFVGTKVVMSLNVTDFNENTNTDRMDSIELVFFDDADGDQSSFRFELEGDNDIEETISSLDDGSNPYEGSILQQILPNLPRFLKETGNNTGIFTTTLEFVHGDLPLEDWVGLKLTITYTTTQDDRESVGLVFHGSEGLLSISSNEVMLGDNLQIKIEDDDLNLDDTKVDIFVSQTETEGSEDNYLLAVETKDDELEGEKRKPFRETGLNTGIFTADYTIGLDIPISEEELDSTGVIEVLRARSILVTFHDDITGFSSSGDSADRILEEEVQVLKQRSQLIVANEASIAPGNLVQVMLVEPDFNTSPRKIDTIDFGEDNPIFIFKTDRNKAGEASPKLRETGNNTGIFTFDLRLKPLTSEDIKGQFDEAEGGDRPEIHVFPGDTLFFRYEDEFDEDGGSSVISKSVKVKTYDPEFLLMPPPAGKTRHETNEIIHVTMIDPDANMDADIKDLVRVRAFSYTDLLGEYFQAIETGKNTGVFNFTIPLVSQPAKGSLSAQNGDKITIQYEDQFPADYEKEERARDYWFSFGIGRTGTDTITIDPPTLRTSRGSIADNAYVFSQTFLSTNIFNNNDKEQPFTVIIEALNMNNVTAFKGLSTGLLQENNRASIGLSWIPDTPGNYTLVTYVLDGEQRERLSNITQSNIQVLSYNPKFYSDSQSYGEESLITITIYDPDANRDPAGNETLDIVAYSSGNPQLRQNHEAREYRPNSGEFTFTIQLSKASSPVPETLPVKKGDEVFIVYTDKMPGNYAELAAEGKDPEREIAYTVTVGPLVIDSMSIYEMIITSDPNAPQPQPIYEATNGTKVFVFATYRNSNNKTQTFNVVFQMVEIRSGYTTLVELQSAELGPFELANFTTSAVLTVPGYYRAKTFAYIDQDEDASHTLDGKILPVLLSRARIADIQINPKDGNTEQ
jgi:hypothetical protein